MADPDSHARDRTPVRLCAHDPDWSRRAGELGRQLAAVLGEHLVTIEHIGSTAIPGISAKPVIDLLPIVRNLAAADAAANGITSLGYDWKGEFGLAGRRYCTLSDAATGERLVHVHIFEEGSPAVERLVAFRDYLRAHPHEALEYEAEKRRAAREHPYDSLAYNDAKSGWIKACEARALAWKQWRA